MWDPQHAESENNREDEGREIPDRRDTPAQGLAEQGRDAAPARGSSHQGKRREEGPKGPDDHQHARESGRQGDQAAVDRCHREPAAPGDADCGDVERGGAAQRREGPNQHPDMV